MNNNNIYGELAGLMDKMKWVSQDVLNYDRSKRGDVYKRVEGRYQREQSFVNSYANILQNLNLNSGIKTLLSGAAFAKNIKRSINHMKQIYQIKGNPKDLSNKYLLALKNASNMKARRNPNYEKAFNAQWQKVSSLSDVKRFWNLSGKKYKTLNEKREYAGLTNSMLNARVNYKKNQLKSEYSESVSGLRGGLALNIAAGITNEFMSATRYSHGVAQKYGYYGEYINSVGGNGSISGRVGRGLGMKYGIDPIQYMLQEYQLRSAGITRGPITQMAIVASKLDKLGGITPMGLMPNWDTGHLMGGIMKNLPANLGSLKQDFGVPTKDFGRFVKQFGDSTAYMIKNQQVTANSLMQGYKYVASYAVSNKLNPIQMMSTLSFLQTSGLQGSMSGNAAANIYRVANSLAGKLGIDTIDRKSGGLKTLYSLTGEIQKGLGGMPAQQGNAMLESVSRMRAYRGLQILMSKRGSWGKFLKKSMNASGTLDKSMGSFDSAYGLNVKYNSAKEALGADFDRNIGGKFVKFFKNAVIRLGKNIQIKGRNVFSRYSSDPNLRRASRYLDSHGITGPIRTAIMGEAYDKIGFHWGVRNNAYKADFANNIVNEARVYGRTGFTSRQGSKIRRQGMGYYFNNDNDLKMSQFNNIDAIMGAFGMMGGQRWNTLSGIGAAQYASGNSAAGIKTMASSIRQRIAIGSPMALVSAQNSYQQLKQLTDHTSLLDRIETYSRSSNEQQRDWAQYSINKYNEKIGENDKVVQDLGLEIKNAFGSTKTEGSIDLASKLTQKLVSSLAKFAENLEKASKAAIKMNNAVNNSNKRRLR